MPHKFTFVLILSVLFHFAFTPLSAFDFEATSANWEKHCSKCHDKDGSGDTKMGKKLKVQDYRDPAVQAKLKDDQMLKAMKEGVKEKDSDKFAMKPVADKLSEEEMLDLVAFIRTMVNKP